MITIERQGNGIYRTEGEGWMNRTEQGNLNFFICKWGFTLTPDQIYTLAQFADAIEAHYGRCIGEMTADAIIRLREYAQKFNS